MATLGEQLKEQRTKLGLSLEQAEEATRIRGRLLEMLENDDYEHLPNPGYVKGYVASYAKYLELDPAETIDRYRRQIGDDHVHDINVMAEPVVLPTREEHALPWKTAVIVVAVIAVLALTVWGAFALIRPAEETVPDLPVPAEATATPEPAAESAPAVQDTEPAAPKPETKPVALAVGVRDGQRSWLRITVDGDVVYEGVLEGGSPKEYQVSKEAKIRIGAPGSVEIAADGQAVAIPDGEIPTVTVKANQSQ